MEAPAVSGTTTYAMLCQAAMTEEQRQAELKKRRQYQSDQSSKKPPSQSATVSSKPPQPTCKPSATKPPDKKQITCWNCDRMGHIAANCRKPRKESTCRSSDKKSGGKVEVVQSSLTKDDPMKYLLSDDSDDDSTEVCQVRVHDHGSKSQCVRVVVQGVPMYKIST